MIMIMIYEINMYFYLILNTDQTIFYGHLSKISFKIDVQMFWDVKENMYKLKCES